MRGVGRDERQFGGVVGVVAYDAATTAGGRYVPLHLLTDLHWTSSLSFDDMSDQLTRRALLPALLNAASTPSARAFAMRGVGRDERQFRRRRRGNSLRRRAYSDGCCTRRVRGGMFAWAV